MGGRVVDRARLESVLGLNNLRGFESLPIRHLPKVLGEARGLSGDEREEKSRKIHLRIRFQCVALSRSVVTRFRARFCASEWAYSPGGFTSRVVAPLVSLRIKMESFSTLPSSAGLSIW